MLRHGLDADLYRQAYQRGETPDESPYSFHLARELGWRIVFSVDAHENRMRRLIRRLLRKLFGFDLIHVWANRDRIRGADIVWTMTEREWLALRCLGRLLPSMVVPVIGNSVWLFNDWHASPWWRKWLVKRLSIGPGLLTVHADPALAVARDVLPPGARVHRMLFGIAPEPQVPQEGPIAETDRSSRPRHVLAMGNDATRDWRTLLAAFGNNPEFLIDLVCAGFGDHERAPYHNLVPTRSTTGEGLSRADLRRRYAWCDIVVVPMEENAFSGITSALDACSRAKPVICTRTGGVPTYFDEGEVLYTPVEDAAAMRAAGRRPIGDLAAIGRAGKARFDGDDYTAEGMMRRYAALSRQTLDGPPRGGAIASK